MSDKQQPFFFSLKVKFVVSYLEDIIIVENLEAIEKNKDENKPSVFLESLTNVLFFLVFFLAYTNIKIGIMSHQQLLMPFLCNLLLCIVFYACHVLLKHDLLYR